VLNPPDIPVKTHGLSKVVDVCRSGAQSTGYDYWREDAAAQQISLANRPWQGCGENSYDIAGIVDVLRNGAK
jgi:hypothetical protein